MILVGLQAAGKSTFYRRCFAATHALVSKDLLHNHRRPAQRQAQLIAESLAAGRSVVVDNTNATVASRAELIALARRHGARVRGYWLESTVDESRARNRERSGRARVPEVAIHVTAKRLVPPSWDEGFDALHRACIAPGHGTATGEGEFTVEDMPR